MSGKRSSSPGDDVSREETGWLDDLRKAKKSGEELDRSDFTSGGTDRWSKLSALSSDGEGPPPPPRQPREREAREREPREPREPRRRPENAEPGRRRSEPESMEARRAAMEAAAANLIGRRPNRPEPAPEPDPSTLVGRRARPEPEPDPSTLVGRRARPEAEPDPAKLVGRRARPEPEPDPAKLVGRRARPEPEPDPEQRRRSPFGDSDPISPAPAGRGSRHSDADEPRRRPFGERPGSNAPVSSPPADEPRRRSLFGGDRAAPGAPAEEERGRRSLFGGDRAAPGAPADEERGRRSPFGGDRDRDRSAPSSPAGPPEEERSRRRSPFGLRPSLGTPVTPPPVEEPRRRSPFGERPVPPVAPVEEPRRRAPAGPAQAPPAEEPRRRSPFAPGAAGRPNTLKPSLNAEPEPIGPSRPLRGAGVALGAMLGGTTAPPGAPASPGMPAPGMPAPVMPPPGPIRPNSPAGPPPVPAAAPHGPRGGLAASVEAIRGARSEVRRQLREQQRLRMWTLIALVVAVVGALPFFFVLRRAATADPVISSLDALTVPSWAVVSKSDNITGSRWCLLDCRYRERTAESSKPIPDTAQAYREALLGAGWEPMTGVPGCEPSDTPEQNDHTCWRRDEFTLDLTVSEPACKLEGGGRRGFDITPTPEVSASPGAETPEPVAPPVSDCAGSTVHIKVFNAIDDIRLRYSPEPTLETELTDEDLNPTETPVSPTP